MQGAPVPALLTTPGENLSQYISNVFAVPNLNEEEERELAENLQLRGCLESAHKLILSHLSYVVTIAKKYAGYNQPEADLIQEGNVGLMKAVKRFDSTKGFRLATFAVYWIKAEILEYIVKNAKIVKIATKKSQRKLFFNRSKFKKEGTWMTPDEAQSVAEELNVSIKEVYRMESLMGSSDLPFNIDTNDDANTHSPSDYLCNSKDNPDTILEHYEDRLNDQALVMALDHLDDRSRDIIKSRWLQEKKAGLADLGKRHGVSAERIRQIEQAAIKKLRGFAPQLSHP